jgi:hypothetical protein
LHVGLFFNFGYLYIKIIFMNECLFELRSLVCLICRQLYATHFEMLGVHKKKRNVR